MTTARATSIGFSAVLMWSLLSANNRTIVIFITFLLNTLSKRMRRMT